MWWCRWIQCIKADVRCNSSDRKIKHLQMLPKEIIWLKYDWLALQKGRVLTNSTNIKGFKYLVWKVASKLSPSKMDHCLLRLIASLVHDKSTDVDLTPHLWTICTPGVKLGQSSWWHQLTSRFGWYCTRQQPALNVTTEPAEPNHYGNNEVGCALMMKPNKTPSCRDPTIMPYTVPVVTPMKILFRAHVRNPMLE